MVLIRDRKVRVVAKLRGSLAKEAESSKEGSVSWLSVYKPKGEDSETVTVTLVEQSLSRRECYEVDFCYEQNQGNDVIYSREVKPLISRVFEGHNATVIACGARGSGKSYMIQGTEEELGIAGLAMVEVLSVAEEKGKLVSMSFYEIVQDRVYDMLDQKRQEVSILEAHGKIQLKGLSQVRVASMAEFQKLYCGDRGGMRKLDQKIAAELPSRSHKGLIIYVSSCGENGNDVVVGKMSFVDLAGYEDARRKSRDGQTCVENIKMINKSIYALQNVVYSLKANEVHVPYRESKLTRLLQGSLGGTNRILLVSCLNPSFCQDSLYMLSLASRCGQGTSRAISDSTKKISRSVRNMASASHKSLLHGSSSNISKKQAVRSLPFPEKKAATNSSAMKTRKLFDKTGQLKFEKMSSLDKDLATEHSTQEEEMTSNTAKQALPLKAEGSSPLVLQDSKSTSFSEISHNEDGHEEVTPITKVLPMDKNGENMDKENYNSLDNQRESPPISARLQELSNNLKSLYFSTPTTYRDTAMTNDTSVLDEVSYRDMAMTNDTSVFDEISTLLEPVTPHRGAKTNDAQEVASFCSPWETFNMHNSGVKNSVVKEYLRFLNTAKKEELKKLKGIGEKRATYILELREDSPEPFKNLDDLKDIGLSAKQVKRMMRQEVGGIFD